MKRVEAIIQPFRLDAVKECLTEIGVEGLTASEVRGFGHHKGHHQMYRGTEYAVDLLPNVKVEIVVRDEMVDDVVSAIAGAAEGGRLWVSPVEMAVRIRTGERGL